MYYVVEGEHIYQCGDEEFQVGPGGVVFLPRGVPHAHRRVLPQAGRLIFMTSPGGLEGFLRILAEASRAGDLGEAAYTPRPRMRRQHLGRLAATLPAMWAWAPERVFRLPVVGFRTARAQPPAAPGRRLCAFWRCTQNSAQAGKLKSFGSSAAHVSMSLGLAPAGHP